MARRRNTLVLAKPVLTPKQELFVREYLRDLNATRAATAAGFSPKNAKSLGYQLLRNPKVAAAIDAAKLARAKAAEIDADWVLRNLRKVYERVVQEITPALDRKGRQITDENGVVLYRFDAAASLRALELIGKHTAVNAYKDQIEVSPGSAVIAALMAGRRRAAGHVIDADLQISERKPTNG